MPNPLLAPALVSAGASLAGGLVGSLTSRSAAKKQFQYQQQLQEQAQQYSRENATTAYNRQRDLTKDNALLQLQGMREAGLSTAFGDGSSIPAAANVDQGATPSPGSAPSVMSLAESFNQGASAASALADLAVKTAQVQNVQSDTEGKDIDNDFKAAKYKAELDEMMSRTKGYKFDNSLKEFSLGLEKKYGERRVAAQTAQAEAEALIKGSAAFYSDALNEADLDKRRTEIEVLLSQKDVNEATKKNLEAELTLVDARRAELRSRAYANYAAGADSYSHVAVNKTQAALNTANTGFVNSQKEGQDIKNNINRATQDDQIAKIKSERVKAWYDALPSNYGQILMSKKVTRDAINNLQNGRDITYSQGLALAEVLSYEQMSKLLTIIDERSDFYDKLFEGDEVSGTPTDLKIPNSPEPSKLLQPLKGLKVPKLVKALPLR